MGLNLARTLRLSSTPCAAFVGAGGKTSALFRLARELTPPVYVTATAHLGTWQIPLADQHIIAEAPHELAAFEFGGVTLVTGQIKGDRSEGISRYVLSWLHEDSVNRDIPLLIEADGARQKPLKAPARHEPPIPGFVDIVVVVAGLSGIERPLTEEYVHRPEIFAGLSGIAAGEIITTEALARVLTNPQGGLKNIPPQARRVALLNQADTPELQARAGTLAERLLSAYHGVVISSLQQGQVLAVHEPTAGIVLAAGESTRFGQPKQLLDWRGQPFVRAVAGTALKAGLSPLIVVTGAHAEQVERAVQDLPAQIVRNQGWRSGQSASIRAGIEALPPETGGAVFLLADQPQVTTAVLRALLERHATELPEIVAPLVSDRRANPVLFDRVTFPSLLALEGDVGGRATFSKHQVDYLPWHDESLLFDVDEPQDYARLKELE